MPPETALLTTFTERDWVDAQAELVAAQQAVAAAPAGIARQAPFDRALASERRCTEIIHDWLACSLDMDRVGEPRLLLSLDVDGVLEDWSEGFTSTGVTGAAALRLLQLGQVAVFLNTAHSRQAVRQRARQFHLFGGVAAFGASTLDALFDREEHLMSEGGARQLARLRSALRGDPSVVLDSAHDDSVRASRIVDGKPRPFTGGDARRLLDRLEISELAFWVAPHYTDFVDGSIDKGIGIERLRQSFALSSIPLAAMGDGVCDVPMLKMARFAFIPAATLPSYTPPKRQRLWRSRFLGAQALWEAACHLVPSAGLQRQVMESAQQLQIPAWFPESLRQLPSTNRGLFPRIAAALGPRG
jgi:3-deoxy-D-manno-octulosonate 8-phosphate phosphatase KdsC-like HAD superfamily phosphatase